MAATDTTISDTMTGMTDDITATGTTDTARVTMIGTTDLIHVLIIPPTTIEMAAVGEPKATVNGSGFPGLGGKHSTSFRERQ